MEEKVSERFKVSAARLITVLFHPLFMPVYGLVVIFTAPTLFFYLPPGVKKILLMILLINNIFIPVALIPFFRYRNIISSWIMEERNDRIVPLIFVSILYIITSFIIIKFNIPPLIKSYICSISVLSLIILIINLRYKISIHSAGAGAITGVVTALWIIMGDNLTWFLIPVLLIAGLILTSRLILNIHKPGQVYSGFLLGFTVVAAVMLFLH